ncbi:hypothetical protein ACLOJK_017673 [Asimina triloba]
MEAEARDSEEEVERGASGFSDAQSCLLTPHRLGLSKLVKHVSTSPQNSVSVKGSLHISKDILLNNKLSSPADKVANSDRAATTDEAKINFQESGHQSAGTQPQTRKDGVLIDGTIGKVIPILANKSSDLTKSDITNEASKPSSAARAVDRSLHPDASKFFKLSFSRKASRKAAFSMVSHLSNYLHSSPPAQSEVKAVDRSLHPDASKFFKLSFSRKASRKAAFSMVSHLSNYLHSSPPAQSEVKMVKDVCSNLSSEKAKSNFSSGGIQSTSAEKETQYAEGQETTPQKSKDALCRAGFSYMETSAAIPFTTTRSSDSEFAPIANNALLLGSCLGNDKNPPKFISTDSASNQPTETTIVKSSSLGRKFLKRRQPVLKIQTSNNSVLSSDGKLINLPCDIEPQNALGKPMDVNNTRKCSGVIATENSRVVEPEAKNYLGVMAIDTRSMVDTSSQEKMPEERLGYLRTSKLGNRSDESDVLMRRLTNHQVSEIGEVFELQHDSDVLPSKRRKGESNKLQTTSEMNMVKCGNAKPPSGRSGKTKGKRKVNHRPKLDKRDHTKGKGSVFLGKADTSNEATLSSENSKDPPDTEKASGNKNGMTGSTSEAEVFTEEVKGPSLPLNKTKDAAVVEALVDAEKENKPVASTSQRRNLAKRLNKKGTFKSKRIPMQSKEAVTRSNSDVPQASKCSVSSSAEPIWFILSGHRLQRKEFQQIIRCLKGRLCRDSHQWSYQATHLIVPDPIKRTEKFFAAASAGRWILKADYLTDSSQAGGFLAEEPFEWHMSSLSEDGAINLEAPRRWRLLRQRTGHGAFHGMQIVIYGDCIAPSLDTMKRVVKAGGGSILATSPPYNRFLKSGVDFAVISPGTPPVDCWVQQFLRHEIPCILADCLVEYVCKPGYSLDKHVLYNTQTWAEKSFARMSARLEEVTESGTP